MLLYTCVAVHVATVLSMYFLLLSSTTRAHLSAGGGRLLLADGGPATSLMSVGVDWAYPTGPSAERTAAVYTPYHLTLGGGERYLLYSAAVLQHLGYRTDVIVAPGNTCNTSQRLLSIAQGLRVPLANDTQLHIMRKDAYKLRTSRRYVSGYCRVLQNVAGRGMANVA